MLGQTISHYRILSKLGGGGMGVVYEAQDLRLGRRVALKFLPEEHGQIRSRIDRFMLEARAASSLNHPNICIVHDMGDYEGRYFIAMELLLGQTLRHVMKQKQVPVEQIIRYGEQIADALDCAHSQGIIHRDIKPANIFLTQRGQVKVLDFGLAKLTVRPPDCGGISEGTVTQTASSDLTNPGEFVGTASYMSPEQARGQELNQQTDLFSLGVMLYEMSTGQPPFARDTSAILFEALLNRTPIPPILLNPSVPSDLERIITRALEKDRALRYQSAAEMRADLLSILSQASSAPDKKPEPENRKKLGEITILYKRNAQPDEQILTLLENRLRSEGY